MRIFDRIGPQNNSVRMSAQLALKIEAILYLLSVKGILMGVNLGNSAFTTCHLQCHIEILKASTIYYTKGNFSTRCQAS